VSVQDETLATAIEVLPEAYAAFNRGDLDRVLAGFDRDFEFVVPPGLTREGRYRGHDGMRRFWQTGFAEFAQWLMEPERYTPAPPDKVLVEVAETIHGRASGAESIVHTYHLWTFRGTIALRGEVFFEREQALEAAGLPR
jgi:ketosteroid isomerase-like protein